MVHKVKKKVFVVIEKYCLTEFDEDYQGTNIIGTFSSRVMAEKKKKELEKIAKKEWQDYKYDVEEHHHEE